MRRLFCIVLTVCVFLSFGYRAEDEPSGRVSVLAVGDNMVHGAVYADAARCALSAGMTAEQGTAYFFDGMYGRVADDIAAADLAFVNQEGPVTDRPPSGYPRFNAPLSLVGALRRVGFDVVNLANNHALDMDVGGCAGGLSDTRTAFLRQGLLPIGTYRDGAERDTIPVIERNGVRIAFLSYTCSTNGLSAPRGASFGVSRFDRKLAAEQLVRAKESADFAVVSVHWGTEGASVPSEEQRTIADYLSAHGADVILGHHPHTLQPIEWINRADGGRTLVAYSLGNFLSAMLYPQYMVGGMLSFDLVADEKGHTVENVSFRPTVCHYERAETAAKDGRTLKTRFGLRIYPMEEYTEALAQRHGATLYAPFTRDTLVSLVERTVAPEFLADGYALAAHAEEHLLKEGEIHYRRLLPGVDEGNGAL